MRSTNPKGILLRTENQNERHCFWLKVSKGTDKVSQTLIGYAAGVTDGIDEGLDGAYFNDSPIALTSLIGNAAFAIQGLGYHLKILMKSFIIQNE